MGSYRNHIRIQYAQDYDEMLQFEANEDLSRYRKTEDTIAIRYTAVVDVTYPYRPKERSE